VDGLARSIRLMTGLGMIAAGSSLAAPAGIELAAWWQSRPNLAADPPWQATDASGMTSFPAGEAHPASGPAAPGSDVVGSFPGDRPWPAPQLTSDYLPPPPPQPLPAVPAGFAAAGPDLASHYRTTLAVPPPPLLDGQRPPPLAVGWPVRGPAAAAAFQRPVAPAPAASYRVRDGDDLTAIAIRFYGTPAAAAAIWQANRGTLRDPGLLPIGVELLLPQPDAIGLGPSSGQRRSIEPPLGQPAVAQPVSPANATSWLERD